MTWRPDLPDAASFANLRPPAPHLVPTGVEDADALRAALALPAEMPVFHLWGEGRALPGKHVAGRGGEALFIRLVSADALDRHRLAQELTDILSAQGVPVCPPVTGFPRPGPAGGVWFASPYRPHRYADAVPADLERLGVALARLHAALGTSPLRTRIGERTVARYAVLEEAAARLRGTPPAGLPAAAVGWLGRQDLCFDSRLLMGQDAQPLHGDLNYGNVCFDLGEGLPWFVDFETAPVSHLSPACDLAMVVDRFIDTGPPEASARLWAAFAQGYGDVPDLGYLRRIIVQLALRSLLLLCLRVEQSHAVSPSEWAKFTGTLARLHP